MSAIDTRTRITKVDVLKLQCFDDVQLYADTDVDKAQETSSPVDLRNEFIRDYKKCVSEMQSNDVETLTAMKMAFRSLGVQKYQSLDTSILKPSIDTIMHTDSIEAFNDGIRQIMPEMEKAHSQAFQHMLGEACKQSSAVCDYKQVDVEKLDNMVRVIAKDKHQHALVSEIIMDPQTTDFMIRTESIGLKGKECEKILDQFDKAMKEFGISELKKTRFTKPQEQPLSNLISGVTNELKKRLLMLKRSNNQQHN